MSIALAVVPVVNELARMPRSIVLDLGWFDGDQTKFEDWWRGIRLFLKSNRVNGTDDRITAILAHLRGGVAGIYAQKKLDKLDEDNNTQDWEDFVKADTDELYAIFLLKKNARHDIIKMILGYPPIAMPETLKE